jgi:hypothetical protein
VGLATLPVPAFAQPDPSGIQFVTVGSPGNAPFLQGIYTFNRGEVDYTYRIGKYEVTTSQWAEFMNAAFDRPSSDRLPFVNVPLAWGAAAITPTNPGGRHWTVSAANDMIPVGGISWRTAAMYCNWLCSGKSSQRSAFLSGAYDVSTFGYYNNGSTFTDQVAHSPGAAYWIPTLDEYLKAASYDPNRFGQGQGGWWAWLNQSNSTPVYGPPGVTVNGQPTTANSDHWFVTYPNSDPYAVPLGAYNVTSAFGLYDTAGATTEWVEETVHFTDERYPRNRLTMGSSRDSLPGGADRTGATGSDYPSMIDSSYGLRVASSIPAPATGLLMCVWCGPFLLRRRPA